LKSPGLKGSTIWPASSLWWKMYIVQILRLV
jgi:hypothetical protein